MHWMRSFPVAAIIAAVGISVLLFVIVLQKKPGAIPQGSITYISGGTISYQTGDVAIVTRNTSDTPPMLMPTADTVPDFFSTWSKTTSDSPLDTVTDDGAQDEIASFLTSLSQSSGSIWGSLTGATTQQPTTDVSSLRAYGNDAGAIILTFDAAHKDMADVMQGWLDTSGANPDSMQQLIDGMHATGVALEALPNIPIDAQTINTTLAEAYLSASSYLSAMTVATSELSFVSAIGSFNSSADRVNDNLLLLGKLFEQSGVTFDPLEPGAVFGLDARMES